jgi:hypothetical protein
MTTKAEPITASLSAVEVEQLRDIRSRLNRVPKGQLGDKSVGPISKGFFDVCARVGLTADAVATAPSLEAVKDADIGALRRQIGGLQALKQSEPAAYRRLFDGGVLQAIATRRLVLGGRERSSEEVS